MERLCLGMVAGLAATWFWREVVQNNHLRLCVSRVRADWSGLITRDTWINTYDLRNLSEPVLLG